MKLSIFILTCLCISQIVYPATLEKIELSEVKSADKVNKGHLYYRVYRDEKNVYLQLINAYGSKLFARKYDLKAGTGAFITGTEMVASLLDPDDVDEVFRKTYNEYLRLAYHAPHGDGSICGRQITSCRSYSLPNDAEEDDWFQIDKDIQVFFGELGNFRTLSIRYQSKLSEIERVSNKTR